MQYLIAILIIVCLSQMAQGFLTSLKRASFAIVQAPETTSSLFSCRRNNKIEKRKRNRDYARKFQSKVSTVIILEIN